MPGSGTPSSPQAPRASLQNKELQTEPPARGEPAAGLRPRLSASSRALGPVPPPRSPLGRGPEDAPRAAGRGRAHCSGSGSTRNAPCPQRPVPARGDLRASPEGGGFLLSRAACGEKERGGVGLRRARQSKDTTHRPRRWPQPTLSQAARRCHHRRHFTQRRRSPQRACARPPLPAPLLGRPRRDKPSGGRGCA